MDSVRDDPKGPGFPIRTFTDQSLLTAPHDFSQCATSFIASWCQGIHQMLLKRLIQQNPVTRRDKPYAFNGSDRYQDQIRTSSLQKPSPQEKPIKTDPEPKAPINKQIHNVKQPNRSSSHQQSTALPLQRKTAGEFLVRRAQITRRSPQRKT